MAAVPPGRCGRDGTPALDELAALYPELPAVAVAQAVERAHIAAVALGGGRPLNSAHLDRLTRDRLDLLRERARTRPAAEAASAAGAERPPVPCTYCRAPVPAETFAYWSKAHRIMSAPCPCCRRRVTILSATWRRLTECGRAGHASGREVRR